MADRDFAHSLIYSTETLIFSILALLLLAYYRGIGRTYVKFWLFSFSALAVNQLSLALDSVFNQQEVGSLIDITIALTRQVSNYLHLLFLMLGIYSATKQKKISPRVISIGVIAAITIGTVATLLYGFDSNSVFNRFYLRESLAAFIFGCGFIAAACYLFSLKVEHFSGKILLAFCVLVGIRFVAFSFASIVSLTNDWFRHLTEWLIYVDVGIHTTLGFIILIWMQGAERHIADTAINRAKYLDKHDALTGVLNREQVLEKLTNEIKTANENGQKLCVYLLDIKRFKFVNDTYGLKVGDLILGETARRLHHSLLKPKVVGRLSGDSFLYVIDYANEQQKLTAVDHIHALIARPYQVEQQEVYLQCSVGYCDFPSDADNADDLIKKSNLAILQARSHNIHSVKYEYGMQSQGRHLLVMEKEIRRAIANEELILYFQPQLNLKNNRLEGAEVLVRWQHPDKGLLAPGQFFDDIEALNLFSELDNYVLEKTCQTIAKWYKTYKRRVPLAINITAVEFQAKKFVSNIQNLLMKYEIPPIYLELEITENVVITDIELVMKTIIDLQNMGIKVSIDDFGTGYSSLAYLRKLPIDKIKIDRSFIQEVASNDSDLTIVKTMIELSHGLGKRVLAEGVETQQQLQLLRNIGCDAVQGYFISKPKSEAEFTKYLKRK
ncbi:EAL domain-containing protein [Colwellia sp. BRX10-3]|uniref:putative bifunctional diguanylate cyclase/phosphodiesterase n=1 Tax=Colwellia sp. BRX10-3 TaxID=2759844 RepID=UPI0015F3DF54|nr:GGDEF domain-containing phosphodiesterase [Colwellia sp. BRX10-3]MBA6392073.1 EAL domain-containing protein [Colwellia sp. BRX10-3]